MSKVQVSVPMDKKAVTAAAAMFNNIALGLGATPTELGLNPDNVVEVAPTISSDTPDKVEDTTTPSPAEVFGKPESTPADAPEQTIPNMTVEGPEANDVEVDSAGMPWDARIHASSKAKLAKDQTWKKKRGVDPQLLAEVEAELMEGIAVPETPAAETVTTPTPPPPPATEQQVPVKTWDFPTFMEAVKAGQVPEAHVLEVCNKHDVKFIPLLATKPDMIPVIAAELGLA